jgi:uncharacterized protein YndB with AHSA1/START domain
MATDPLVTAGLVTREVRSGSRDGAATKVTVARRTYPATQADLWDTLTSTERLPRWFLPVSGDLTPGGRFQVEGNAGGVVQRCDQPTSFSVTWEFGGTVSWLTVTLTPDGAGTTLELAHEAPVTPDFYGTYGPGALGVGWDLALMGLGLHIDSGAAVDPQTAVTFPASPEGREFIREAAGGWAAAAIADGEEQEDAWRAGSNTVNFYTGTSPDGGASSDGPAGDGLPADGGTSDGGAAAGR